MFLETGMKNDGVLQNVRFERPMVEHIRKWGFHPVVIGNRRSVFKIWQAPNLQPSAGGIQQDRRLRTGSTLGFPAEDLFRLGHLTSEVARYREARRVAA